MQARSNASLDQVAYSSYTEFPVEFQLPQSIYNNETQYMKVHIEPEYRKNRDIQIIKKLDLLVRNLLLMHLLANFFIQRLWIRLIIAFMILSDVSCNENFTEGTVED